jgi:acyl transferase domain-containing protein
MLETCLLATLDAGYSREELSNRRVGVYIGTRSGNYMGRVEQPEKNTIVGVGQNFIGARISDFFNWRGNNLVVDSACSSSLVSVHLACQALREGEIDAAAAGGVDLLLDELTYLTLSAAGALSPDGRCHTFDERANGFVPGEGAGALVLKRLDDALRDGDRVYAVIRGSAVNNDGRTMGITTPNLDAQVEVIEAALARSGVSAAELSYVEAHGTGTMIGDPIELKALTRVFQRETAERGFCAVGSVKTNIGHLLSAAGVAGLVKTALSLHHRLLPPTLHCDRPNPRFAFDESPLYVNRELRPWATSGGRPRRAGISAFGFGGTNCHMVLEELTVAHEPCRAPLPAPVFARKSFLLAPRRPGAPLAAVPDDGAPLLRFEPLSTGT